MNRSLEDFNKMIYKVRKMRLTRLGGAGHRVRGLRPGLMPTSNIASAFGTSPRGGSSSKTPAVVCEARPAAEPHSFDVRMWNSKIPIDELGLPPL